MFSVLTIYLSPGPRSYSYVCGHERLPWIGLRRFCLSARDDGISIGMKNVDKSLNVFDSNSLRVDWLVRCAAVVVSQILRLLPWGRHASHLVHYSRYKLFSCVQPGTWLIRCRANSWADDDSRFQDWKSSTWFFDPDGPYPGSLSYYLPEGGSPLVCFDSSCVLSEGDPVILVTF